MNRNILILWSVLIVLLLLFPTALKAQQCSFRPSKHYRQRMASFRTEGKLPKHSIVMFGDSHIEYGGDWNRFFNAKSTIINRGIVGDDAVGMLRRLAPVLASKPRMVFFDCGTNDLSHGWNVEKVYSGVVKILASLREKSPGTRAFLLSLMPLCPEKGEWKLLKGKEKQIVLLNKKLCEYAARQHITFIDTYSALVSADGIYMQPQYNRDGLHLSEEGYAVLASLLREHIEQ